MKKTIVVVSAMLIMSLVAGCKNSATVVDQDVINSESVEVIDFDVTEDEDAPVTIIVDNDEVKVLITDQI